MRRDANDSPPPRSFTKKRKKTWLLQENLKRESRKPGYLRHLCHHFLQAAFDDSEDACYFIFHCFSWVSKVFKMEFL